MLVNGPRADGDAPSGPTGTRGDLYALLDAVEAGHERGPQVSDDACRALYRAMLKARLVDERMAQLAQEGRIGFYASARGEEATLFGSVYPLRDNDWIFPSPREPGVALWRGYPLADYVSQLFGNGADPAKGRQMPAHHSMRNVRCVSISSPVGTQIPQAVGVATAARIEKRDDLALAFFGEGTTSSSEFHVGLNFGGVWKAAVVLVCKSGRDGAHTQTAASSYAMKAVTYGVRAIRVDGTDLLAMISAVELAAQRARGGDGPTLIEAVVDRSDAADPLVRWRRHLEHRGLFTQALHDEHARAVQAELDAAIAQAERTPPPALETLFDDVYAELTPKLVEQKAQLLTGPRAPKQHG